MLNKSIISLDTFQRRKQVHLFSMAGQLYGFTVEVIYLIAVLVVRVLGRKIIFSNSIELINSLRTTEFGVISTLQVLSSKELRQKLIYFVKRH